MELNPSVPCFSKILAPVYIYPLANFVELMSFGSNDILQKCTLFHYPVSYLSLQQNILPGSQGIQHQAIFAM